MAHLATLAAPLSVGDRRDGVHGGDIYLLSSCSSGRITRLALADVRGHGETVLALAGSLRRLMRRHIDHINQDALVEAINREFAAMGDTSTFATGLVATFFLPTRTLSLTNARHPAPLLFRPAVAGGGPSSTSRQRRR